ncbi:WAP four-disulfide core domain protein 18-like [Spea bombifrons]|uniref:WAP four-disulfide core domain protein 18-like n=1 Tax=Spea bombifrons TaxID=233779 RepID=UPI00234BC1D4|nr:WAP four-disulfide core domain protein 18-like [Spea bombifrons]
MKAQICLLLVLLVDLRSSHGQEEPTTEEKHGSCPKIPEFSLGRCGKECTTDADCEGNLKCCTTGCDGLMCQVPDEKQGVCPEISNGTTCDSTVHCTSDSKCDEGFKCCPTGCDGFVCQPPKY